jgi:hypothetical protein
MYTKIGTFILFRRISVVLVGFFQSNQENRHSSKENKKYQLLYTKIVPPDDGP